MHIEEHGTGTPVLLLHGGGVAGWMWRPALAALNGEVRSVVPDLPGHGRSRELTYTTHADVCGRLADAVERRAAEGVVVAGFSLGAQLAILLAATRPDLVKAAVIVSAETKPAPAPGLTLKLLGAAAPLSRRRWFAELQARQLSIPGPLVPDFVEESAYIGKETLLRSVGENIGFTLPAGWSRFGGRAVVMVGEKERRLMRESARLTKDALPGSELISVPGRGHDIPFHEPGLLATTLRRLT